MTDRPIVYIDLGVGGMTCDDCAVRVAEALESVAGVQRAQVSLPDRSATVEAAPTVEAAALASAVRAAGDAEGHHYNAFERGRRLATDG